MGRAKKLLSSHFKDEVKNLPAIPLQSEYPNFYDCFTIHGFQIQKLQPGHILCTWKVPARLTDASGALHTGVIATIIDVIGAITSFSDSHTPQVSVDMSISYISTTKLNDEIKIDAKVLGHKGGFCMTCVILRNKATGEAIAEGRNSFYSSRTSKL